MLCFTGRASTAAAMLMFAVLLLFAKQNPRPMRLEQSSPLSNRWIGRALGWRTGWMAFRQLCRNWL